MTENVEQASRIQTTPLKLARSVLDEPRSPVAVPSVSERIARVLTDFTGSTPAFLGALAVVLLWAAAGPFFGYSETWQLVINTGTTIVTFLMVFLIQRAQNKDSLAIHLKLDELVAALRGASNKLVSAEDLPEEDLNTLREKYRRMMEKAACEEDPPACETDPR